MFRVVYMFFLLGSHLALGAKKANAPIATLRITAEDRDTEKRMCDPEVPVDTKVKVVGCMEEYFPDKVVEAGTMCAMDVLPGIFDRMAISDKMCNDPKVKRSMVNCMRAKSIFIVRELDSEDIDNITVNYRQCAREAFGTSKTTPGPSTITTN
ncbi:hypothetical protein HDE_07853 [Halotydeus destructor]|nr:hypothetical protein HDE_07853 [Halotydeus destructor]